MRKAGTTIAVLVSVLLCASACTKAKEPSGTTAGQTETSPKTTQSTTVKNVITSPSTPTVQSVNENDLGSLSNKKVVWGPGKTAGGARPADPVNLQEKYGKYGANFIAPDSKKIYLTFDEGYENGYTPKILDVLKEKNVKAVFFVTYDFAKSNPELIKRMIDEGHTVGNHTYRHKTMDEIPLETAKEEIQVLHDYIQQNYNYTMTVLRPPKGEFSERTLALTQQMGYKTMLWSFAYADWDPNSQMEEGKALQKITSSAHNGAIYLLHAVSKTNTNILGTVIDQLQGQGYEFASYDL